MSFGSNFAAAKRKMLEKQLIARGISSESVISAFRFVPRELFVPEDKKELAYSDSPVSIGAGQTVSQPYMVALMTQLLNLKKTDKVLEIGTGSGFQTAILAYLSREVYTVERIPTLQKMAKTRLAQLGFNNVFYKIGDGTLGWEEFAKYDKIIVTAGSPKIPKALIDQLKEKGTMVIPVGDRQSQVLKRITNNDGKLIEEEFGLCVFVPLIGKNGWDY